MPAPKKELCAVEDDSPVFQIASCFLAPASFARVDSQESVPSLAPDFMIKRKKGICGYLYLDVQMGIYNRFRTEDRNSI
jgi:hypothetical protein